MIYFQRSYNKQLFDDAISRMVKAGIKLTSEIEAFKELHKKVEQLKEKRASEDFDDIPDEFLGNIYACGRKTKNKRVILYHLERF